MVPFVSVQFIQKIFDQCIALMIYIVRTLASAGCKERTCSPCAHPPHHRIRASVHLLPMGANMKRYCAPPRQKQCVVK